MDNNSAIQVHKISDEMEKVTRALIMHDWSELKRALWRAGDAAAKLETLAKKTA